MIPESEIEIKHLMEKAKIKSSGIKGMDYMYVPLGSPITLDKLEILEKASIEKYIEQLDVEVDEIRSYISSNPELTLRVYITIKDRAIEYD